jgi:hypothetical protein
MGYITSWELMTEVVSLIVAEIVEQREFSGSIARAKSRPGTTRESPLVGREAWVSVIDINAVELHSNFLSTKTFSEGT